MFSRNSLTVARRMATRSMSTEAAATHVKLNFSLPHETIYHGTDVHQVILPGSAGEYGITANHVPYVAQLKPGVMQILHEEGSAEPEKYFLAGGYALTHEDSSTDVVCPEAVKLDDLDSNEVTKNYEASKAAFASAAEGSVEKAEAQISMEVNQAMGTALGITIG